MIKSCKNCGCGCRAIPSREDEVGIFCSSECRESYLYPNFCDECLTHTVEVGSGGNYMINGIGTTFYGGSKPCPQCKSVVRRLFWCLFFIPVVSLGLFRVKFRTPDSYISRRIGSYRETDGQVLLDMAAQLEGSDRDQAIAYYSRIVKLFPGTSASEEAKRSIETLMSHRLKDSAE